MHVKTLKYKTYISKEISIFILYYFESQMRTRINCIPRHDDAGKVPLSENLSIFFHLR